MSAAATVVRYDTTIINVGPMVSEFLQHGMIIIFGEGAPEELLDFCALHRPEIRDGGLQPGDRVLMDDVEFTVLAVGSVADTNLRNLGHVSFKANGENVAPLPGDVCLERVPLPQLNVGSRVKIVAGLPETERTS